MPTPNNVELDKSRGGEVLGLDKSRGMGVLEFDKTRGGTASRSATSMKHCVVFWTWLCDASVRVKLELVASLLAHRASSRVWRNVYKVSLLSHFANAPSSCPICSVCEVYDKNQKIIRDGN